METLAESFGSLSSTLLRWSAVAFVLLNGAAIAAVAITRSRHLVNRWTSRLVAANLFLLATGLGVPAVASAVKLVIQAVSASQATTVQLDTE
jgi:hypothetical protein